EGSSSFNGILGRVVELPPEVVENWEIGLRSDWVGGVLRVNAELFDSHWTSMRVTRLPPDPGNPGSFLPKPYTEGNGAARMSGLETAITYLATDRLLFDIKAAWLDTAYEDWGNP